MTELSTRLPNSTRPWNDAGATIEVAVQRGHVSQPRPESVNRTAAPLTTSSPIATAAKTASRRKVTGETVGARIASPILKTRNDHDVRPRFRAAEEAIAGLSVMIVAGLGQLIPPARWRSAARSDSALTGRSTTSAAPASTYRTDMSGSGRSTP